MARASQVHRERELEQVQIAANQNRARIPTWLIVRLEHECDSSLVVLALDTSFEELIRAAARWELQYRRAYGITITWNRHTGRNDRAEVDPLHSTRS